MKKTTYAELFTASLEVATGEKGLYRCPLCLGATHVADADSLTWDHYPPQSVGARRGDAVLICHCCRERWNHTDEELMKLKRKEEFDQRYPGMEPGVFSIPGDSSVRGLRHRIAIDIGEGRVSLFGRPEDNAEEATERLTEFLDQVSSEGGWDGLEMSIRTDGGMNYSGSRVGCSFLKAAYLAAFDHLGYPYILSSALVAVRQQMLEPETEHLTHTSIVFASQPPESDRPIILAYVHTPEPLTSLGVFFLGYRLARWPAVFLPLPTRPGLPEYGHLEQALRDHGRMGFVQFERSRDHPTDRDLVIVDESGREWPMYESG